MPRPVPGRRPDSLFDNRYRYDYIYPRGRSGETLRAYDTQNNNQPVVIKRPALQDAPPIRAGQEVSILKEKRALEALSGHPVLTELRHTGTFRVGGQPHQYIAMDMAQGETVESMVLAAAQRGERLPELETLTILDNFLDLLQTAHDRHIIYNDVDAKHLFWDREHYLLKVIDWGNAVFQDSESTTHVNRSSDILQIGQLLYFIYSGGRRLEAGRADPAGDLGDTIPGRLKAIINRAANPEANQRYSEVSPLRQELAEVRRPLEKNRDMLVERVRTRLPTSTSQSQLEQLRDILAEALQPDPGFPTARTLQTEVDSHLKQLSIQSDLDAVRIYMESGNYTRAATLLQELLARMGDTDQPILHTLLDFCNQLEEITSPAPAALAPAISALLKNDAQQAARILVTTPEMNTETYQQQFLLAERVALRMPGVVLLRPHLVRLNAVLQDQNANTGSLKAPLKTVATILSRLDETVEPGIQPLVKLYQRTADTLVALQENLQTASGNESALEATRNAQKAADDIVELLEVVAQNVVNDPSRAGNALWRAAAIDPINPAFEAMGGVLNNFHAELDTLRGVVPAVDGNNVGVFLSEAQQRLAPYASDISDARYQAILNGIETASSAWTRAIDFIAMGGRRPAVEACRNAAEAIKPLNPAISRWFEDYAKKIDETPRVEFLSPNTALGKALSDGWEAWDRGRGGEAQAAGERAIGIAQTDGEKIAARRLSALGEVLSSWLSSDAGGNIPSTARIDQLQDRVLSLLLPEEETLRRKFADQMPTMQTYLKAMVRGVVEPMRDASAAALRALYLHYVLRGIQALNQEKFDDANNWREAASKTLTNAKTHPAYQVLDNAITRRQLVLEAVRLMNSVKIPEHLTEVRPAVRAPLASAQLDNADQAVRSIDEALRRWPDGDFRSARLALDNAVERLTAAENIIGKDLTPFKTWVQDLGASAEILQQSKRVVEQAALVPTDEPDPAVAEALQKLIDITRRDLGDAYTAQIRQWRDTYTAVRDLYLDKRFTKEEKLRLFDQQFAAMFIDRQPALPIFRHWQNVVRALPDPTPPPPPPIVPQYMRDTTPKILDDDTGEEIHPRAVTNTTNPAPIESNESDEVVAFERVHNSARSQSAPGPDGMSRRLLIGAALIVVLIVMGTIFALIKIQQNNSGNLPITLIADERPTLPAVVQSSPTVAPSNTPTDTRTPVPTSTATPTSTPTQSRPVPTPTLEGDTSAGNPTTAPNVVLAPTANTISSTTVAAVSTGVVPTSTLDGSLRPTISSVQLQQTQSNPPTLIPGGGLGKPVPTNPDVILPTAPPSADTGDFDLLPLLDKLTSDKIKWDTTWFGPGVSGWQLGNQSSKSTTIQYIRLTPEVLTSLLGTNASSYVQQIDVTLQLVNTYDPKLIATGQIYYGAGLENALRNSRADVRARLVRDTVLDVGTTINGTYTGKTQIPYTNSNAIKMTVKRNADKTLSLFVDDQALGQTSAVFAPGTPLTIYLYTSQGGVMVNVTSLKVHLSREN